MSISNFFPPYTSSVPQFKLFSEQEAPLEDLESSLTSDAFRWSSRAPDSPLEELPSDIFGDDSSYASSLPKFEFPLEDFDMSPVESASPSEAEAASSEVGLSSSENSRTMSSERKGNPEKMERAASPVFLAPSAISEKRKALLPPSTPRKPNKRLRIESSSSSKESSLKNSNLRPMGLMFSKEEPAELSGELGSSSSESSRTMSLEKKGTSEKIERAVSSVFLAPSAISEQRKIWQPPPTPRAQPNRQANRRSNFVPPPSPPSYEKACQYNQCGEKTLEAALKEKHPDCKITLGDFLGEGKFSKVYSVSWKGDNKQVIKIPNFQKEFSASNFLINKKYEILNYFELKKVGFPVISFFNLDEMLAKRAIRTHVENQQKLDIFCFTEEEMEIVFRGKGKVEAILSCHFSEEQLAEFTDQGKKNELEKILLLKLRSNWLELPMEENPLFSVTSKSSWLEQFVKEEFEGFYRTPFIEKEFLSLEELAAFNNQLGSEEFVINLQKENHPLYQLKEMFRLAYKEGIAIDLKQDNVRIQEDGKVILCDLYYDPEDEDENPFHCMVTQKLDTFAKEGSLVWKYLDPRPT